MAIQYRKAEKPKVLTYFPTNEYGKDGDTVVSKIAGKGVFFCVKAGGLWYAQTTMQPLKKINTAYIKNLESDKLTFKRIENAGIDTNKFVVLKDNSVKYRTGDDILDDLDVFASKKINFKTAYCSLGQYSDKESCEANGGTWYYSENDSHDSISSTAENQLLTVGQSIGTMDSEPTLLYDGSTLEIKRNTNFDENWHTLIQGTLLKLTYDSDNSSGISTKSNGAMNFNLHKEDASFSFTENNFERLSINTGEGVLKLHTPVSTGTGLLDYFAIDVDDNAVTTITTYDTDGAVGHLTLQPDGDLVLDPVSQKTIINATDRLYFDGGGDTYISESSADNLRITVGGDTLMELVENGNDGNQIKFGTTTAVGFIQSAAIYDAVNTVVDFRKSNKFIVTFGSGNMGHLSLYFPEVSGNFQLLVKQDGTGSRTITGAFKVYEFDESTADGSSVVVWAGGSAPTLTTDANHVDILSFYWDATNEIAYGVATLDFQF